MFRFDLFLVGFGVQFAVEGGSLAITLYARFSRRMYWFRKLLRQVRPFPSHLVPIPTPSSLFSAKTHPRCLRCFIWGLDALLLTALTPDGRVKSASTQAATRSTRELE